MDARMGCMDAWMHGWMDVWMYGCMDEWMDGWMRVWLSVCLSVRRSVRPSACMYVCMRVCAYVQACVRACVRRHVRTYVCICTHIKLEIRKLRGRKATKTNLDTKRTIETKIIDFMHTGILCFEKMQKCIGLYIHNTF